jgi:hypothetical protein
VTDASGSASDALLASDAERDAVVARLSTACGEGRLSLDEFVERSERVQLARTRGDLSALVADLPGGTVVRVDRGAPVERQVTLLGNVTRRGRWRLAPRATTVVFIGGADLEPVIRLRLFSLIGGVSVRPPRSQPLA